MEAQKRVEGIVAALDRADVDTDQIIPKQFLKRIERTGYGPFLFNDWRFNPDGSEERVYASGLRNPVGLAFHPTTGALWACVNERDGFISPRSMAAACLTLSNNSSKSSFFMALARVLILSKKRVSQQRPPQQHTPLADTVNSPSR